MFCNDRVEKAVESFYSFRVGCVARIQSNKGSIALMDIECIESERRPNWIEDERL